MSKYNYTSSDAWTWSQAIHTDVPEIVQLSDDIDTLDIAGILSKNPTRLTYHLHQAILDQSYGLNQHLVMIARDKISAKLMAWAWITRGKFSPYADEEMAVAELCSIDSQLPARTKIKLAHQTLEHWIHWCKLSKIPVLCSTTIRENQTSFMRLHEQLGFLVRGSFAYKRIENV